MENENINDLNEQDIIDLYDDIIETPMQIAAFKSTCPAGQYAHGNGCCYAATRWGRVGAGYGIITGACYSAM